jgi:cholesterol transport system auxiliary component
MMGRRGGGFRGRSAFAAAIALVLALSACASGPPPTLYDLAAATPPAAHAVRSQFRIGQATATADLDSDHILVRESQTLATLAGAQWPESLPALFRARLAESFQNAGLARWIDGPAANANYEIDLDIRAFELDAQSKEVNVDIAAWIVSLGSGRIMADQIFTLRIPVASTDPANVAAAMDQAASTVMSEIVAFVARKI